MIELHGDTLHLRFPNVHPDARASISFQRTLRVPDDNQDYPLPAGLGRFPLESVDDFPVPAGWHDHGGVFLPIRRAEALWISLDGDDYPMAVKIAAGKINAVTGSAWSDTLSSDPQDYVVVPDQPWLDGFHVAEDVVRQFVAMPLGEGATAEEQLRGEGLWGGLQIIAYPMKASRYEQLRKVRPPSRFVMGFCPSVAPASIDMGLAPGGRIMQDIEEDPYGLDAWDMSAGSRCFVHLLNAELWPAYTGQPAPASPITPAAYREAGIPWFEHYADGPVLPGSSRLAGMDGLASFLSKRGQRLEHNTPLPVGRPVQLGGGGRRIRGSF